jgi:RimJ/RimL family protein N-acetyltransferase
MFGPSLTGTHVRLRAPRIADLPRFRRWYADPAVVRHWWTRDIPWARWPPVAALLFLVGALRPNAIVWVIEADGKPIGHSTLRHIDRRAGTGTVAVLIGERTEQRRGYAREAAALRNRFAADRLGLRRLRAIADGENKASLGLLESSGYRLVRRTTTVIRGREQELLEFEFTLDEVGGASS